MAEQYSFSLTTFSPSGKLVQIEYALQAVNQGVISLGIKAKDCVVLATEKKSASSLILQDSIQKIAKITPDIGAVYAGLGPDFRVLVDKARKVAHTNYKRIYLEEIPVKILVQEIAKIMQEFTQSGGVRPFGVSILVAGYDEHGGSQLYQVDPSGSFFPWKATAIGKGSTSAKTFLEKRYSEDLELEDAIHSALLTLKEGFEGEMTPETIEIGIIGPPNTESSGISNKPGARFRNLTTEEIKDYLDQI